MPKEGFTRRDGLTAVLLGAGMIVLSVLLVRFVHPGGYSPILLRVPGIMGAGFVLIGLVALTGLLNR